MTFDDFLERYIIHPSPQDFQQLQAFYDRAKEEFSPLQAKMSSDMYDQFTMSYARLLMVQLKVYEKQLNVEDFSQHAYRLLGSRVQFVSHRYPIRPPQKLRHVWIPDSVDDPQ